MKYPVVLCVAFLSFAIVEAAFCGLVVFPQVVTAALLVLAAIGAFVSFYEDL